MLARVAERRYYWDRWSQKLFNFDRVQVFAKSYRCLSKVTLCWKSMTDLKKNGRKLNWLPAIHCCMLNVAASQKCLSAQSCFQPLLADSKQQQPLLWLELSCMLQPDLTGAIVLPSAAVYLVEQYKRDFLKHILARKKTLTHMYVLNRL